MDQAERVIAGQEVVARARDIQEVINYRKVMGQIGESRKCQKAEMKNQMKTLSKICIG